MANLGGELFKKLGKKSEHETANKPEINPNMVNCFHYSK